jgi:hypothetical protein
MQWQQKLDYMKNKQAGVPGPGSTGNVSYAPGMMNIFSGNNSSVPSARQMQGPQQLMENRNWQQRAKEMPMVGGSPGSTQSASRSTGQPLGPQISPDIMQRIMQAIDADSKPRY